MLDSGVFYLYDDTCGHRLRVEKDALLKTINGRVGPYVFQLRGSAGVTPLPKEEYNLECAGVARIQEGDQIRNPLDRCALCNCTICSHSEVSVDGLTSSGIVRAKDAMAR